MLDNCVVRFFAGIKRAICITNSFLFRVVLGRLDGLLLMDLTSEIHLTILLAGFKCCDLCGFSKNLLCTRTSKKTSPFIDKCLKKQTLEDCNFLLAQKQSDFGSDGSATVEVLALQHRGDIERIRKFSDRENDHNIEHISFCSLLNVRLNLSSNKIGKFAS